ncbi:MAG: DUF512 domain-containing protein [Thermodesulfovibrionales bacterium]
MAHKTGIEVETVRPGSPADRAGLRPGDVLVTVNGHPLRDVIDFLFHKDGDALALGYRRGGAEKTAELSGLDADDAGLTFTPFPVKTCRNNCIFCFVKQLPRGLRKTLYVKDEDYRLSFLFGNYITLSNITPQERERIVNQHLSPIYISVHTTRNLLRNSMLGCASGVDIMKELRHYAAHKIRMHVQIVLCPGYNDGPELRSTIQDLYRLHPHVASIAVVPVGLTRHRKEQLAPVAKEDALRAVHAVEAFQKRFRKKHGEGLVYCSDEMYIRAGLPLPPLRAYDSLPQLENGVGMVPLFLAEARAVRPPLPAVSGTSFLTFTGTSFYPYARTFVSRLAEKGGLGISVIPVVNDFFGSSVTVTGLLTGQDVIRAVKAYGTADALIVPDVVLRDGDTVFLDDVSLDDLADATGMRVVTTDGTPQGLVDTIAGFATGAKRRTRQQQDERSRR